MLPPSPAAPRMRGIGLIERSTIPPPFDFGVAGHLARPLFAVDSLFPEKAE
jgi:hypothetical protein